MSAETATQFVTIESVDLDGPEAIGYYVDELGTLESIDLTDAEALAIHKQLARGAEGVGYVISR